VINRTVLPSLVGGTISYVIADSGATYNTQKKHCCYILPGIFMKHMMNDKKISTVQTHSASKSSSVLRIQSIKEVGLYLFILVIGHKFCILNKLTLPKELHKNVTNHVFLDLNQKLPILNNCGLYYDIQKILRMKWFELRWSSIFSDELKTKYQSEYTIIMNET